MKPRLHSHSLQPGGHITCMLEVGQHVWCGLSTGEVWAYHTQTYEKVWSVSLNQGQISTMECAPLRGQLYFGCANGVIIVLQWGKPAGLITAKLVETPQISVLQSFCAPMTATTLGQQARGLLKRTVSDGFQVQRAAAIQSLCIVDPSPSTIENAQPTLLAVYSSVGSQTSLIRSLRVPVSEQQRSSRQIGTILPCEPRSAHDDAKASQESRLSRLRQPEPEPEPELKPELQHEMQVESRIVSERDCSNAMDDQCMPESDVEQERCLADKDFSEHVVSGSDGTTCVVLVETMGRKETWAGRTDGCIRIWQKLLSCKSSSMRHDSSSFVIGPLTGRGSTGTSSIAALLPVFSRVWVALANGTICIIDSEDRRVLTTFTAHRSSLKTMTLVTGGGEEPQDSNIATETLDQVASVWTISANSVRCWPADFPSNRQQLLV